MSPAEIARGLTVAQREELLTARCNLPPGNYERSDDCVCSLTDGGASLPPGLTRLRGMFPNGLVLTPLGLAVRAALQETDREA